jgi:hypothetical protein
MLDVPTFLDFGAAENEAAALARHLTTRTRGWEQLLAVAQGLMMRVQDLPDSTEQGPDDLFDYPNAAPIVAAARIFDTLAEFD